MATRAEHSRLMDEMDVMTLREAARVIRRRGIDFPGIPRSAVIRTLIAVVDNIQLWSASERLDAILDMEIEKAKRFARHLSWLAGDASEGSEG